VPTDQQHHAGDPRAPGVLRTNWSRLVHAWRALDADQRLAAIAAGLMFFTMFLPWYQQNAVVSAAHSQPLVSRNLSAFAVFSFVEAAVLLVAVAVLTLLFARAERRDFHLPGGDGTVVLGAGIWTAVLLVWRLFDKPGVIRHGIAANVGIQWGMFFALAATGLLTYAGSRMRAARPQEPPLRRTRRDAGPGGHGDAAPRADPDAHGDSGLPSEEEITVVRTRSPSAAPTRPSGASEPSGASAPAIRPVTPAASRQRPRHPPAPSDRFAGQLSFEDPDPPRSSPARQDPDLDPDND
jgi:hypothetical protein